MNLLRILPLVVLVACPTEPEVETDIEPVPETYNLTFNGSAYDASDGLTLYSTVVEDGTLVVMATEEGRIEAGVFSINYGPVITEGEGYTIFYYVDGDEDLKCAVGRDSTGYAWFGSVAGDVDTNVISGNNNEPDDRACDHF